MNDSERARHAGVTQQRAKLVENTVVGAYHRLKFEVPQVAELARAGQFVSLTVGGDLSGALLRRSFSISAAMPATESNDGRIELVVSGCGKGSDWLVNRPVGEIIDMAGPLGRPFPLPMQSVGCVLVGGGYGSAPLFWLAQELRKRGCRVSMVLGAANRSKLYGVPRAQRAAGQLVVTTDDGSLGVRGRVTDPLGDLLRHTDSQVVYACGPMAMLQAVTAVAHEHGAVAQVAVEESMACGVGVCMTCVMPVVGRDGETRMVRSCVEGPTFRGDRVRWDAFGDGRCRVPEDAVGAPGRGGH